MELNLFMDFVRIIFCSTQFLALITQTKSESNIPTFDGRQTKLLQFELSNKVQSNVPPVSSQYCSNEHKGKLKALGFRLIVFLIDFLILFRKKNERTYFSLSSIFIHNGR